jgi:hypothetical protein
VIEVGMWDGRRVGTGVENSPPQAFVRPVNTSFCSSGRLLNAQV